MNQIKNLRQAHIPKMSQKKLGILVGVGRSTVAMWECGKSEPDNTTLLKLSEIFCVSTDFILGRTDQQKEPTTKSDGLSEAERALVWIFRQIPPEEQERVIRIVQAASDSLRQSQVPPAEVQQGPCSP